MDISSVNNDDLLKDAITAQGILYDLKDGKPYVPFFLLDCCREYGLRDLQTGVCNPRVTNPNSRRFNVADIAGPLIAFACARGTIANNGTG